ncbi:hypothetical protein BN77_p30023 [Rhizobium mesoamericanum STM3625]|uniref:Uncharacterized protein n=1 Tax=Rhizobium mesoamericanum STM3625 TaxID=1211777 RepID=K0Q6C1_9HYPH|nr:hypothetical protein BN77_p30023 [Rhizobium mesoamericanum STM3625]
MKSGKRTLCPLAGRGVNQFYRAAHLMSKVSNYTLFTTLMNEWLGEAENLHALQELQTRTTTDFMLQYWPTLCDRRARC